MKWWALPLPTQWRSSPIHDLEQAMKAKLDGYWSHCGMNCSWYMSLLLHRLVCSNSQVRWAKSGAKESLCGLVRCLYASLILSSSILRVAMSYEAGTNFPLGAL